MGKTLAGFFRSLLCFRSICTARRVGSRRCPPCRVPDWVHMCNVARATTTDRLKAWQQSVMEIWWREKGLPGPCSILCCIDDHDDDGEIDDDDDALQSDTFGKLELGEAENSHCTAIIPRPPGRTTYPTQNVATLWGTYVRRNAGKSFTYWNMTLLEWWWWCVYLAAEWLEPEKRDNQKTICWKLRRVVVNPNRF